MKKLILSAIAIIAFLSIWETSISAQSNKVVKVNVAFNFQVKDKTFPAGEYYIETTSRSNDSVLSIRSAGKDKKQIIIANQLYANKIQQSKLVFQRQGENYVLTGIFLESGQWGYSLPISGKKAGKDVASRPSETVELPVSK